MGEFDPDAYVVQAGWRGFCVMLLVLLGWTGLGVVTPRAHHLTYAAPGIWLSGLFEVVFLVATGHRAWLAIRRKIVFAGTGA